MRHHTLIASEIPTTFPDNIHRKPQSKHTAGSILALAAGITLGLASSATNAVYGYFRYDQLAYQLTWGAVSVAASVILALGPTSLLKSIKAKSLAGSFVAVLAIALCGSYSFSAAIGASAGQRINSATTQSDTDATRKRLQDAYQTAKEELQGLPTMSATVAQLDAQISALKATPGANNCEKLDGPISKKVCPEAASLEVERAKAAHQEELQAKMTVADDGLKKLGPPKVANTDAAAISGYLAMAGFTASTDAINPWLVLLAVALVEFGGGLSFALSSVLREPVAVPVDRGPKDKVSVPVALEPVDTPEATKRIEAKPALKVVSTRVLRKKIDKSFGGKLMELVSERGGEVHAGHRALGKALGCSTAHVGNVLRELSTAGRVTVQATKMGTVIRLAA